METREGASWPFGTAQERNNNDMEFPRDEKHMDVESLEEVSSQGDDSLVVGSADLYDENGNIRLVPMPSADPKDPLNLPMWRKWAAVGVLCFFGSLALSAEAVIGGLLPIFLLEYAGVDPRTIRNVDFVTASHGNGVSFNLLAVIPPGVKPPDLGKVTLLATVPLIANGIASYFLVPLSIAVGRRPVLLLTGVLAWAGGLWAGLSTSIDSHMMARAMQGLGAGAVEALIPLITQDLVFIHQRNKAMSAIVSSQGVVIIGLGIAAPYVAANFTWRYLYFATSGLGIIAWLLLIFFLPETRWTRAKEALGGKSDVQLAPGQQRPELDIARYGPRTLWTNIGMFHFGLEFKNAGKSMLDTLRTTLFPAVVWSVLANSIFLIVNGSVQQLVSFILLAQGWEFQWTGLSVIPLVIATVLVFFLGGPLSDKISNALSRRHGGTREAEFNLANMILPFLFGLAGTFVFGYAGQNNLHWLVVLFGSLLLSFGALTIMTTVNVFIIESYPQWAGPVLVNVSSLRITIAFFLASQTTTWVSANGLLNTFVMFAEAMIVIALFIPVLWFSGKKLRMWTAGKVSRRRPSKKDIDDAASFASRSRWSH